MSQSLATRYPLVLVPGMLGFVRLGLFPYWYGIVPALRATDAADLAALSRRLTQARPARSAGGSGSLVELVTGLLFAGRAGSALTAEIGNMKSTEQISSLEMIGVDPLKYIIAPRLWAGFISMPLLAAIFSVVGIWGGAMVAIDWLGVYEGSFWANMQNSVSFYDDVLNGVIKSVVFAFVVTWIAVFQGYDCEPTSEGISRATTRTVVYASLAVLGLDFILTALMFGDF